MDSQYGDDKGQPPSFQDVPQMGYPQPGPAQLGGSSQQPYPGQQPYPVRQVYPMPGQTMIAFQSQAPLFPPEKDYLGYSIFTLLCCCLPLGIAALIYSSITRDANSRGDRTEAAQSSRLARNLNNAALGIGLVVIIGSIIYVIAVINAAK